MRCLRIPLPVLRRLPRAGLCGGNLYGPDPALCDYFRNGTGKLFEPFYDPF